MSSKDILDIETQMHFPYPQSVITMSDSRIPCRKWGEAIKDKEIKKIYDSLEDKEKDIIKENLGTRQCQNVQGVSKCVTLSNKLEPCSKMPVEIPNNLKANLNKISHKQDILKKKRLAQLDDKVDSFRKIIENLISHHQTRQNMKSLSLNYKGSNNNTVGRARVKQSQIGDQIEKEQRDKDFIVGQVSNNRMNYKWYNNKNSYLVIFNKILLLVLILVNIVYLLTSRFS